MFLAFVTKDGKLFTRNFLENETFHSMFEQLLFRLFFSHQLSATTVRPGYIILKNIQD